MLKHKGTIQLETDRLILKRFEMNDCVDMFNNWATDLEVTQHLTWQPHENITVTKGIIGGWIDTYGNDEFYNWAIVIKEIDQVVGSISIVEHCNLDQHCEVGYCSSKAIWGNGYMTEALSKVIEFLFEEVNFNRISAIHYVDNTPSGIVMKKSGMKYEGCKRKYKIMSNGKFVDCESYALLKSDRHSLK